MNSLLSRLNSHYQKVCYFRDNFVYIYKQNLKHAVLVLQ